MNSNYFNGLQGISFGVFVQKGPQGELGGVTAHMQPGFVDKSSHQSFVQNIFSTSPYCSVEIPATPHAGILDVLNND